MEKDFILYKVRPQDNLASLASKINMDKYDLKDFHNQYCEKKDYIWFDSLSGVQHIMIPLPQDDNKTPQHKQNAVSIDYKNFYSPKYSVTEVIQWQFERPITIDYSVHIDIRNINNQNIAEVSLHHYKKDGKTTDDKISSLSLACMESIYPLQFLVSKDGKIEAFYEHKNIIKKFKEKRPEIEDFFVGEVVEDFLNQFYENISNEDYFFTTITSSPLYQSLFPKAHWFQKNKTWNEILNILPNSFPLEFSCEAKYPQNNSNETEITISAVIAEECSLISFLKGAKTTDENRDEPFLNANISLKYAIENNKTLSNLNSEIQIWNEEELYYQHQIKIAQII